MEFEQLGYIFKRGTLDGRTGPKKISDDLRRKDRRQRGKRSKTGEQRPPPPPREAAVAVTASVVNKEPIQVISLDQTTTAFPDKISSNATTIADIITSTGTIDKSNDECVPLFDEYSTHGM